MSHTVTISMRVAVLLTCHNRRSVTLAALRRLLEQVLPATAELTIFLVDDGSSDGTGDAVRREFPHIRVLRGDGSLFWSGGMRLGFAAAMAQGFDYYLWLNDDTFLEEDAIARLLTTHAELLEAGFERSVVVGATRDPDTGITTYGGVVRASRWHPLKFRLLAPGTRPLQCATMNGNIVLIPKAAAQVAGNISLSFTHSMGDSDYGLRARGLGCTVWLAPGHLGSCSKNPSRNTWRDASLPVRSWWRKVVSLKGLPPGDYSRFARAHGGPLWPIFWLTPYTRVALGFLWHRMSAQLRMRGDSMSKALAAEPEIDD